MGYGGMPPITVDVSQTLVVSLGVLTATLVGLVGLMVCRSWYMTWTVNPTGGVEFPLQQPAQGSRPRSVDVCDSQ